MQVNGHPPDRTTKPFKTGSERTMIVKKRWFLAAIAVALPLCCTVAAIRAADRCKANPDSDGLVVYIGTSTRGASEGIYLFRLDPATGRLQSAGLAAETVSVCAVA